VLTHRVVNPAFLTAAVVFVLALEYQAALTIKLLSRTVELTVHICSIENTPIFICVHPLPLQSIIYIETLQGTADRGNTGDSRNGNQVKVNRR